VPTEDPPDLWPEIERRLAESRPIRKGRFARALAAGVALVLFAASAVFVWWAFTPAEREGAPVVGPLDGLGEGWTRLPDPPETRPGAAHVWSGSELLAWSGCVASAHDDCVATRDGYAFDPLTVRWSPIPPAPSAIPFAHAVWTGDEAIFLSLTSHQTVGGVAYDPSTATWRTIADASIASRDGAVVLWAGSRIFVWGGGEGSDPAMDGALYDPASDTWTSIARSPIALNQASGVWTGSEVIVFGALLDAGNPETETSVGAAYDPALDTWRMLPPSELSPQAVSTVWVGDQMVAWDYLLSSQDYDPATDAWGRTSRVPLKAGECHPDSLPLGDIVLAFYCGQAALYDTKTTTWQEIHGGMLDEEIWSDAYRRSVKLWRFAGLVSAGDVAFLAAEGITLNDKAIACYGCSGSPTSLWAYRPQAP
jgi:hypothetical protein